jgi:hypothetical protein
MQARCLALRPLQTQYGIQTSGAESQSQADGADGGAARADARRRVAGQFNTQSRIVEATQDNVKELASAIQISVQELTSVGTFDLQNYVNSLHTNGPEVSIASIRI